MIKVGITGAESQLGGELLRLLLHHPEVEISVLYAPALRGRSVSSFHKGVVGDTDMRFSDTLDLDALDVLFLLSGDFPVGHVNELPEHLKVIEYSEGDHLRQQPPFDALEFVAGLSEMYRKPLVRGARASRILPSSAAVALIALYPLALHLLLNDKIRLTISLPAVKENSFPKEVIEKEIEEQLQKVQLSFKRLESIELQSSPTIRAVTVDIEFPCTVTEKEIERIYNDIYDDHNFTFLVRSEPEPAEIAGTQKCLIYISKPSEDTLHIKAVADGILRGGAGDAVHVMNLLFGLFEKTGLSLQASLAFIK